MSSRSLFLSALVVTAAPFLCSCGANYQMSSSQPRGSTPWERTMGDQVYDYQETTAQKAQMTMEVLAASGHRPGRAG